MAGLELADIAIIGAGPAGITAAIYAVRKNLKVRIFEAEAAGGQTAEAILVENYPGFKAVKGAELTKKMAAHLQKFGVRIEQGNSVEKISKQGMEFEISLENGSRAKSRAVIIATGTRYRKLNVHGEEEFYGKGVSYCATCDGPFFRGKTVAVVGAGNSGAAAALLFAEICKKAYLIEYRPELSCDAIYKKQLENAVAKKKLEILTSRQVLEIAGKQHVEAVKFKNRATGSNEQLAVDGVFVYIGFVPENSLAKMLGLQLDEKGYIKVNSHMQTSVRGIFAAGDITGGTAQTIVAAGSGAEAAIYAYEYLQGLR